MQKRFCWVFEYMILGIGMSIIGLLLIPAGVLVMLVTVVWRVTDRLVLFLGKRDDGIREVQKQSVSEPERELLTELQTETSNSEKEVQRLYF